jgi:hypothetical protein
MARIKVPMLAEKTFNNQQWLEAAMEGSGGGVRMGGNDDQSTTLSASEDEEIAVYDYHWQRGCSIAVAKLVFDSSSTGQQWWASMLDSGKCSQRALAFDGR